MIFLEYLLPISTLALGVFTLSFQSVWARLVYFILCIVIITLINAILHNYSHSIRMIRKQNEQRYEQMQERNRKIRKFVKKLDVGQKIENIEYDFVITRTKYPENFEEVSYHFKDGFGYEVTFKTRDDIITTISVSE